MERKYKIAYNFALAMPLKHVNKETRCNQTDVDGMILGIWSFSCVRCIIYRGDQAG